MNETVEIRKLPISVRIRLSQMLDVNGAWKLLMGVIPSTNSDGDSKKYSSQQVKIIEDEAKRQQKPGFDILIDEWGTSGKCRPTIHDLMQLFISVDLYQAADYLSMDVLKLGSVPRPQDGPSAPVPVVSSEFFATVQTESIPPFLEATNPHLNYIATEQEESEIEQFDTTIPHLLYSELEHITDNFNLVPVAQKGRKLGAGAFGTVFLGQLPEHPLQEDSFMVRIFQKMKVSLQSKVAVKRLSTEKEVKMDVDTKRLFQSEVEIMSRYCHENLLKLIAYSANGSDCCLVYSYMPNGSLEGRLACEDNSPPLQWNHRLDVAQGVALGLIHLHTSGETPLVHRDVKSANVLLDHNMKPKLGDFGLVRASVSGNSKTYKVLGTSAYMAPEAFRGDISVKLDTFSFGVIILELLTGLPPYDPERDGNDLISHIDDALDEKDFIQLLDPKIPPLPENMATSLHSIALACIEEKKKRPFMTQVHQDLLKVDS